MNQGAMPAYPAVHISYTAHADVPVGPVCVNWAYRTNMPPEQNFRCPQFRDESQHISNREAQSSGLGYSGGTINFYRCALFDASLSYEHGVGPKKCAQCIAAALSDQPTRQEDASDGLLQRDRPPRGAVVAEPDCSRCFAGRRRG